MRRLLKHLFWNRFYLSSILPPGELQRLEQAVALSETQHSAQLRVVVEHSLPLCSVLREVTARDRAESLFSTLRIWDTQGDNGVLLYVLFADRKMEILADRGVAVSEHDWEDVCSVMTTAFQRRDFVHGLEIGIERITKLLHMACPPTETQGDELPNRIVTL